MTDETIDAFQAWVKRLSKDKSKAQAVIAHNMECSNFSDVEVIKAIASCDLHNPVCKTNAEGWIGRLQYFSNELPLYYRMGTLVCYHHVCKIIDEILVVLKSETTTDIEPVINQYSSVCQLAENTHCEIQKTKKQIRKFEQKLTKLEVQYREDLAEQDSLKTTLLLLHNGKAEECNLRVVADVVLPKSKETAKRSKPKKAQKDQS